MLSVQMKMEIMIILKYLLPINWNELIAYKYLTDGEIWFLKQQIMNQAIISVVGMVILKNRDGVNLQFMFML